MKTNCNIIYDLLPLYIDGICSEESKSLVDEHLHECPNCSKRYAAMNQHLTVADFNDSDGEPDYNSQEEQQKMRDNAARKVMKRITRKWKLTVLITVLLIPLISIGWNQYRGEGLSYTNMYDYYSASRMMKALENEQYEKAFSYIDVKFYYDDIQKRMEESKTATISKEEFQLVVEEALSYYTNGEIRIAEEKFDNWIIEAQKENIRIKEFYEQSPYVDMTYDKFYSISKANFLDNMKDWEQLGYRLKGHKIRSDNTHRDDDLTQYNYNISISNGEDTKEFGGIDIFGNNAGQFHIGGGFHDSKQTSPKLSSFFQAFNIFD
ncbi:zf-HC2 domain-containing protein [Paenibacillus endoradicis]|uniref:zf-HC2 domain-containing protein n=1 Tax=Paenibacillus endoradicis TaxID=2972487 RepID=UPI0021599D7E|nr:zf-HC2 domain-containing protein [Paenibacillus endoradicis]MCR8657361.1 zf-HC2 domain-containing protein [Paenibacillus endoradicis]